MRITVARVSGVPARVGAALDLVARALTDDGWEVASVEIPVIGLPSEVDEEQRRLLERFVLTPGALIESWRVARHLDALVGPRETVLLSDYRGTGGVFTLEQAAAPPGRRRTVWTAAGESTTLMRLDTFGTLGGYEGEAASATDWEIAQYRFSDVVVSPAQRAVDLLKDLGTAAIPIPIAAVETVALHHRQRRAFWLPEVVSRRSKTPAIVRGLEADLNRSPNWSIVVSSDDDKDEIWSGTTWASIAPVADQLGDRIARGSDDPEGVVVLGDPFAVPDVRVLKAYVSGRTVVVPAGSTASALMPEAEIWVDEDDLTGLVALVSRSVPHGEPAFRSWPASLRSGNPDRARTVSVGVPVYRDVRYLDECIQSILDQGQQPHEVILFDDGSASADVDAALAQWAERGPGLISLMRGPNRGVCVARNAMLDTMTGDAFVLVDSDDVLHPEFIEACSNVLRSRTDIAAVASWTDFFDGYNGIEAKPPFDTRVGLRENPIISTAVLVDMSVRDDGIRFAPDLAFLYCEDWHVWSQIAAAGGRFGLVPRPLVRHRVHPSSGATLRTPLAHTVGRARATQPIRPGDLP